MGPIVLVATAIAAGAAGALCAPVPATTALAVAILLASVAVPLPAGRSRQGLLILVAASLSAANAAVARDTALAPSLGVWFAETTSGRGAPVSQSTASLDPVELRGVLLADGVVTDAGAVRLLVRVREVRAAPAGEWHQTDGVTRLFVQGEAAASVHTGWTRGRSLQTTALLRWPPVALNPGGSHPIVARLARGYVLSGTVKSAALIEVVPGSWWQERAAALRRHVRRSTAVVFGDDRRQTAAVVTAILIGDRAGLDRPTTERLIAAGTYHVVAISGGNVALLTMAVVGVLRRALRSPRVVATAALGAVLLYGWVIGGEPSVTRAVTAAAIWLAADALGLRVPPGRLLALVAIVVVARDPLMTIAPGAWLSFGATLGIIACAGRLVDRVVPQPAGRTVWRSRLRVVAALGAATVAAELVLLPVGAWTFSRVSVAGLLLNFAAIPAMAVTQVAGALVVVFEPLAPLAARAAALVAHASTVVLIDSSRLLELVPHLAWRVPPPHPVVMAAYYVVLAVVVMTRGASWWRRPAVAAMLGLLTVMATGPGVFLTRPPRDTLRVTFLDVGQGDATVVQFPSGHVLVVDAGAAGDTFDSGERIVTPALWALGARRVDWVAFTHADLDHIGGVAAVAAEFGPLEVWEGVPVFADASRASLYELARSRGFAWRQVRQGDRLDLGGADVAVLHPSEPDWERPRVRNDDSIVLRIRYGPLDVLLTGDVGQDVERLLARSQDDGGDVRVLKVAHHGSRTSTSAALVDWFKPWAAVISAGRNNNFGHPVPEVLDRLNAAGTTVLRTDRDGSVIVECDGQVVRARTWRGRTWRVVAEP